MWIVLTLASAAFSVGVLVLQLKGTIDDRGAILSLIGVVATLTVGFLGVAGRKLDRILKILEEISAKK